MLLPQDSERALKRRALACVISATALAGTIVLLLIIQSYEERDLSAKLDLLVPGSSSHVFWTTWNQCGAHDDQSPLFHITSDSKDNIYAMDDHRRIQKFSPDGTLLAAWGEKNHISTRMQPPIAMTSDSEDNLYVVDGDFYRIQKFSSNGTLLAEWPYGDEFTCADVHPYFCYPDMWPPGLVDVKFSHPTGMTSDSDDNLYVADHLHDSIQKFSPNGTRLAKWNGTSGATFERFSSAYAIASDRKDNIYVGYVEYPPHIRVFSPDGTFLTQWRTTNSSLGGQFATDAQGGYMHDAVFTQPTSMTIDSEDNLYVADPWQDSIKKFSTDGRLLETWDTGDYITEPHATEHDMPEDVRLEEPLSVPYPVRTAAADSIPDDVRLEEPRPVLEVTGPYGITSDSRGNIYAVDYTRPHILVFKAIQNIDDPYENADRNQTICPSDTA